MHFVILGRPKPQELNISEFTPIMPSLQHFNRWRAPIPFNSQTYPSCSKPIFLALCHILNHCLQFEHEVPIILMHANGDWIEYEISSPVGTGEIGSFDMSQWCLCCAWAWLLGENYGISIMDNTPFLFSFFCFVLCDSWCICMLQNGDSLLIDRKFSWFFHTLAT